MAAPGHGNSRQQRNDSKHGVNTGVDFALTKTRFTETLVCKIDVNIDEFALKREVIPEELNLSSLASFEKQAETK